MACEDLLAAMQEALADLLSDQDQLEIDAATIKAELIALGIDEAAIGYTILTLETGVTIVPLILEILGAAGISVAILIAEWQYNHDLATFNQDNKEFWKAYHDYCACIRG
jgi:hypothetical protein